MLFPPWTVYGDQDDLDQNWAQSNSQSVGSYNKNTGKATFKVKYSDHNDEYGLYVTDIYAYDDLGNVSDGRKHVDISPEVFLKAESTYNGHRYELYDYTQGWTKAKEYCESKGGHLVTITSAEENNAVLDLGKKGGKGHYYIGAESVDTKGTWRWVTGETFSYANWDPGSTEGNTDVEPYAELIVIDNPPNKQSGEWVDGLDAYKVTGYYHYSNGGFICEYENDEPEHEHTIVIDSAVSATCYSIGYTEGNHCSECGETIKEQQLLPMVDHKWNSDFTTVVEPTCEEDGYEIILCSACGEAKEGSGRTISKLGHEYEEWIMKDEEEHQRLCKHNGSHVETETHKWDDGVITKPATETQEGTIVYKCTACEATKNETLPVLSHIHQLSRIVAKEATCTEDGNIEYWKCNSCGKIFSDSKCSIELNAEDVIIPATGHEYGEWTRKDDNNHQHYAEFGIALKMFKVV